MPGAVVLLVVGRTIMMMHDDAPRTRPYSDSGEERGYAWGGLRTARPHLGFSTGAGAGCFLLHHTIVFTTPTTQK